MTTDTKTAPPSLQAQALRGAPEATRARYPDTEGFVECEGLPSFAAILVEWMIAARIDANWNDLDALHHPADFHLPILLFHGTDDETIPISTSNVFAKELLG